MLVHTYIHTYIHMCSYIHMLMIMILGSWMERMYECGMELDGHVLHITFLVQLQDDSDNLLSSSYDGMIKMWDIYQGRCLRTIHVHAGSCVRYVHAYIVYIYIHTYIYIYIYINININICSYIHTYIHTHVLIHTYICFYMLKGVWWY